MYDGNFKISQLLNEDLHHLKFAHFKCNTSHLTSDFPYTNTIFQLCDVHFKMGELTVLLLSPEGVIREGPVITILANAHRWLSWLSTGMSRGRS